MQLVKTDKAREELASRQRRLQLRERAALLMADGSKTRTEMLALMQDDGSLLNKLIADGYLAQTTNAVTAKDDWNTSTGFWSTSTHSMPAALTTGTFKAQVTGSFQTTGPAPLAVPVQVIQVSADNFEGKRSLATTRMFLFDICERMFVRKLPAKANLYRDQLRAAKDRESMLAVAREMINDIEEIAGHDRADGISERIASLLPPQ